MRLDERIQFDIDRWRGYDCTDDEIIAGLRDTEYLKNLARDFTVDIAVATAASYRAVDLIKFGSFVPPTDEEVQDAVDKLLNLARSLG